MGTDHGTFIRDFILNTSTDKCGRSIRCMLPLVVVAAAILAGRQAPHRSQVFPRRRRIQLPCYHRFLHGLVLAWFLLLLLVVLPLLLPLLLPLPAGAWGQSC